MMVKEEKGGGAEGIGGIINGSRSGDEEIEGKRIEEVKLREGELRK
jgi:hypothetical protein